MKKCRINFMKAQSLNTLFNSLCDKMGNLHKALLNTKSHSGHFKEKHFYNC